MDYEIGDVVWVHYPFEDDPQITKLRPAVIVEIDDIPTFLMVQITSKNRSDKNEGRWVTAQSDVGQMMGLKRDSFINYHSCFKAEEFAIVKLMGFCPFIDEIKRYL
ncbi:type II toxin-antitoxin system PemK/MazF family toxin [Sphingobacterium lactis]|uniref:type II toxin-antitoxin system PemK/MazF family toxin n=1 Tax=Sphingobacterium lactis TaxID=797291 RepID=UPI003EC7E283